MGANVSGARSADHLAKLLAKSAQRIRNLVLELYGRESTTGYLHSTEAELKRLVADLDPHSFADLYAQTVAYGLFTARLLDKTADNFTVVEALQLIPRSNPVLYYLFKDLSSDNPQPELRAVVDNICQILLNTDLHSSIFTDDAARKEATVHFYEGFLKEYDPEIRKKMGVWYTPNEVVKFIIRKVDELLRTELKVTNGLANGEVADNGEPLVQILDPATGTGTFLNEVVRQVRSDFVSRGRADYWQEHVEESLLKRLFGFELMMVPYVMAHMNVTQTLGEADFDTSRLTSALRPGIYLTNSLAPAAPTSRGTIDPHGEVFRFDSAITFEQLLADEVKERKPIKVVIGNPPYSIDSGNNNSHIRKLVDRYRKDAMGVEVKTAGSKSFSDDYIKFIAFAEDRIREGDSGVLGLITNNSFLSTRTMRGLRSHLLSTFDKIFIVNLRGSGGASGGGVHEGGNVFDITTGVTILIGVKNKVPSEKSQVFYAAPSGTREQKFEALELGIFEFEELTLGDELYFFPFTEDEEYRNFIAVDDLFVEKTMGVDTHCDAYVIHTNQADAELKWKEYKTQDPSAFEGAFSVNIAKSRASGETIAIRDTTYRPLDKRKILWSENLITSPRALFRRMSDETVSLLCPSGYVGDEYSHVIAGMGLTDKTPKALYNFPLYLISSNFAFAKDGQTVAKASTRKENFDPEVKARLLAQLSQELRESLTPESVFDYLYGLLNSPNYRAKYSESLKRNFPRIAVPKDDEIFERYRAFGAKLRPLHLMQLATPSDRMLGGSLSDKTIGALGKKSYDPMTGRLYINKTSYVDGLPVAAWEFFIGGYQPAQKWLKDRRGETLTGEMLDTYSQIIFVLSETERLMRDFEKSESTF